MIPKLFANESSIFELTTTLLFKVDFGRVIFPKSWFITKLLAFLDRELISLFFH